jgi:hypothetical protein
MAERREINLDIDEDASTQEFMEVVARTVADLSFNRDLLLIGPLLEQVSSERPGVEFVFPRSDAVAGLIFVELDLLANDSTRDAALGEMRQALLSAMRGAFHDVRAFDTLVEFAEAAVLRWPCAATIALRDAVSLHKPGMPVNSVPLPSRH